MYGIDSATKNAIDRINSIISKWQKNDIIIEEWNDYDPKCFYHLIESVELGEVKETNIMFVKTYKLIREPQVIGRTFETSLLGTRLGESHSLGQFTAGQVLDGRGHVGHKGYLAPSFSLIDGAFKSCKLVSPTTALELMKKVSDTHTKDIERKKLLDEYHKQKNLKEENQDRESLRNEVGKILDQINL